MKLTTYFIKHPVISIVLNGIIVLLGLLCFFSLPVREYPDINFPKIIVEANYPNASVQLVETAVTNVLEEKLAGVEGIETITSQTSNGSCEITLNFRANLSMDRALMAVQDAIALARALLPKEVREILVERSQKSEGLHLMTLSLESTSLDFGALTHYANLHLKNALRSIKGVAQVEVWGQPYTYTIALDPKKMVAFGVNADEIFDAIADSQLSYPTGRFRDEIPATLNAGLKTQEDYENLLIKTHRQHPVFLKSVASIKLKADEKEMRIRINGNPGVALGIMRASDANPLEVSETVQKEVVQLQKNLPPGLILKIFTDQADFIRASLRNIQSSIIEAILLVLAIVFLFLRNGKATLIPLITIPISLLGTLLFLKVFHLSINTMTLLAMVLAVGLVVDDAIVVLENITRHIESGLTPLNAAIKGAKEIGFAIVAMTLTLTSVYAPIAFIPGIIGQIFSEFAVALAGSVLISGIVALTLSPLMCTRLLSKSHQPLWPQVDHFIEHLFKLYEQVLTYVINKRKLALGMVFVSLGLAVLFFRLLPSEIAPKEDRNLIGVFVSGLPDEKVDALENKMESVKSQLKPLPEAKESIAFIQRQGGNFVIPLKPHTQRKRSAQEIVESLQPKMKQIPSTDAHVWSWEYGLPGLEDTLRSSMLSLVISTTDSYEHLFEQAEMLKAYLDKQKLFPSVHHDLQLNPPTYSIDLNAPLLPKLGLTPKQIAKTIEIFFSGDQSLRFQKDGFPYTITLQGTTSPWTLDELYMTNALGHRISLGAIAQLNFKAKPASLFHYNQMRSMTLNAELGPGQKIETASNQLLAAAKKVLPATYKENWTGTAKVYQESSNTLMILFVLSLIFIYAVLSIQFENFLDPFIILMTVPMACSGALLAAWFFGESLNVYTQIGLITLVGLISKHGILIVEFSNQLKKEGFSLLEAVKKASSLRLRPILMTTGAMVFGAIPLILSHDAGFEARRSIGIILVSGLSIGTLMTLFVFPAFYYGMKSINRSKSHKG